MGAYTEYRVQFYIDKKQIIISLTYLLNNQHEIVF